MDHWIGGSGLGLGLLAPEIYLPNFYPPHVGVGPALLHLCPPTSLDGYGFFNSVILSLLVNSISDGSGDGCSTI